MHKLFLFSVLLTSVIAVPLRRRMEVAQTGDKEVYSSERKEDVSVESINRIIGRIKAYERHLRMIEANLKRLNSREVISSRAGDQFIASAEGERAAADDSKSRSGDVDDEDVQDDENISGSETGRGISTQYQSLHMSTTSRDSPEDENRDKNRDLPSDPIDVDALKISFDNRKSLGINSQQLQDPYSSLIDRNHDVKRTERIKQQRRNRGQFIQRQDRGRFTRTSARYSKSNSVRQSRSNRASLTDQGANGNDDDNDDDDNDDDDNDDDDNDDDSDDNDTGNDDKTETDPYDRESYVRNLDNDRTKGWMIRSGGNDIESMVARTNSRFKKFNTEESKGGDETQPEWRSAEWKASYNMLLRRPNYDIRL